MSKFLSNLTKISGNLKKSKRVGRGYGSGKGGHTVGRGTKGQKSRAGKGINRGFEGGQYPLYKRIPQVAGFNNPTTKNVISVSISALNFFEDNSVITPSNLLESGAIKKLPKKTFVKILGSGKLERKNLTLEGFLTSKLAADMLAKADCNLK